MPRSPQTSNPFITTVADGADFCDRTKELAQLEQFVLGGQSVVLSSPRRYGKTSLTRRALEILREQGFLTVYVDFFSVLSGQDFVTKLARAVITGIGRGASPDNFRRRLVDLFRNFTVSFTVHQNEVSISATMTPGTSTAAGLDDILTSLLSYVQKNHRRACCVFDEFQEISTLPEAKKIEGTLREHISMQKNVSFIYVGSRRHLLMDIFDKNRPFYGSAMFLTLDRISSADFVPYIVQKFSTSGKTCSPDMASTLYDCVAGYPIYVQELAAFVWNMTGTACTSEIIDAAWNELISSETPYFQAIWMGLTPVQRRALNSLATRPTAQPLAHGYLEEYGLSASGMAKAMKTLEVLDLVEREQKEWHLVDPVMAAWIRDTDKDTI